MSTSRSYTCRFFRQGFQSEQRGETLMDSPEVGLSQTWCAWQKLRRKGEVRAQPCWELRAEVPRAPRDKGDLPWQRCSAKTTISPSIPTSHPKPIWRDTKPSRRHPVPLFPDFWGHGILFSSILSHFRGSQTSCQIFTLLEPWATCISKHSQLASAVKDAGFVYFWWLAAKQCQHWG